MFDCFVYMTPTLSNQLTTVSGDLQLWMQQTMMESALGFLCALNFLGLISHWFSIDASQIHKFSDKQLNKDEELRKMITL